MGNFTALGIRLAVFMLVSLAIGMAVREYARALHRGDAATIPRHASGAG